MAVRSRGKHTVLSVKGKRPTGNSSRRKEKEGGRTILWGVWGRREESLGGGGGGGGGFLGCGVGGVFFGVCFLGGGVFFLVGWALGEKFSLLPVTLVPYQEKEPAPKPPAVPHPPRLESPTHSKTVFN